MVILLKIFVLLDLLLPFSIFNRISNRRFLACIDYLYICEDNKSMGQEVNGEVIGILGYFLAGFELICMISQTVTMAKLGAPAVRKV